MQSKKNKKNSLFKRIKSKFKNSPLYWRTLIMLLFVALILKWFIIYFSYKNLNPRENVISFLASDIIVVFIAHLLITINFWIKKRSWRLIIDFIVFLILIIFIVDIFTIFVFQSRVTVMDALTLWSNGSSWFSWIVRLWMSIFIITWLVTFFLVQVRMPKSDKAWKNMVVFFSICTIFYAFFYISLTILNVKRHQVENIISLNLQKIFEIQESDNFDEWIDDKNGVVSYEDYITKVKWEWKDLNIILVFAESLSAIDSANMWWNDNMPNFDKIQNDWIIFNNFLTNWTTSDTAHISTLYWVIPLINMRSNNTPYSWYKLKMEALPEYFNNQWYMTTFISAAWLKFLQQRSFLSWAGFQKIIWEEEFENNKKYTFESAPDGDLYDRVLKEIKAQTWKYFIGLQTISFHKPYDVPYWKSEKLAIKYADDELYRFYESLQELGFFDSWILVIVWDHRKMNPIEENEYDIFKQNWYTKSVATVVWSGIQPWTLNSNIIQHTDFYNSIKKLVWHGLVEVDKTYNDIFSQEKNRNWWITNSEFYENNRYTVSSEDGDIFLFKNLSNLSKDNSIYDYFSSYISFEFWDEKDEKSYFDKDPVKFIWHRWAINGHPENTLESFLAAKELWADWIEFDVSYTKDKENIVVHWDLLYASNCKKKKVWNLKFNQIQKDCTIINGEKYMRLQKMLELIDWLFDYYFLEIKVYDEKLWAQQAMDAIQTVKDLNMQDRVIFISYSDSAREVLNSDPDIIFWWDTFDVNDLDFIWDNNSKYFLAPYDILTVDVVEKAKNLWKEVVTYTVNNTWDFQSMKDLWINIILSDDIWALKEYESKKNKTFEAAVSLDDFSLKKSIWWKCYKRE